MFWGPRWVDYLAAGHRAAALRPQDADQQGSFYPAWRGRPAAIDLPWAGSWPRLLPAKALATPSITGSRSQSSRCSSSLTNCCRVPLHRCIAETLDAADEATFSKSGSRMLRGFAAKPSIGSTCDRPSAAEPHALASVELAQPTARSSRWPSKPMWETCRHRLGVDARPGRWHHWSSVRQRLRLNARWRCDHVARTTFRVTPQPV
jgi:hypothetical protein